MSKKVLIGAAVVLVAASAALVASGKVAWFNGFRSQDKVLRERIEGYWQARVAGDAEALAQFKHPLQEGGELSDMLITDAYAIEALQIDGDAAIGAIRVRSHVKQPQLAGRTREHVLKSRWVRYEGQWYQDIGPANFKEALKGAERRMHPEVVASSEAASSPVANGGVAIEDEEPLID